MSFIEKLRQESELRERLRLESEAAEKAFHQDRKDQAFAVYKESGIGFLVGSLSSFLVENKRSSPNRFYVLSHVWSKPNRNGIREPIDALDADSVFDNLIFDYSHGKESGPLKTFIVGHYPFTSTEHRRTYYEVDRNKDILVETQPDGNIVFHGAKREVVSRPQWKISKKVLEDALEAVFNNPFIDELRKQEWDTSIW